MSLEKRDFTSVCDPSTDPAYWLKAIRGVPYQLTPAGRKRVDRELAMYLEAIRTAKLWLQRHEAIQARQSQLKRDRDRSLLAQYTLPKD